MSFILKRLFRICKDSIIDVAHRLVPTTISALKSRRGATLLCNDVKISLLCDTTRLHLRTRRAIYLVTQDKHGLERILAKDLKASRHGWEKLLRRRNRATSTCRVHRAKLALSPVSQPPCASPHASSHPAAAVHTRAHVVTRRHAQLWQAKMRALMQRRKEVYRNVCNVLAGHKAASSGPMEDLEPAARETRAEIVPMEDVQPAPLVYAAQDTACSRSPTSPTMSWFCRNLSQARPAQPAPALPPLPSVEPVPLLAPMPPSRRAAAAQPVRPERQAKPVFWGGRASSARAGSGCVAPAPSTTMTSISTPSGTRPRGPRRMGKPAVRDRDIEMLPLTTRPRTPFKPRRFGGALGSRSQ